MRTEYEVYRHSGRFGWGLVVLPFTAILVSVPLGAAYVYASVFPSEFVAHHWSPKAALLVSVGPLILLGIGLGFAVAYVAYFAKCRSYLLALACGGLAGLLACYMQWGVFASLMQNRIHQDAPGAVATLTHPASVWDFAVATNRTGWRSIGDWTPTGGVLWGMWIAELAALVLIAAGTSIWIIANRVFCERCKHWCGFVPNYARLAPGGEPELLMELMLGDFAVLESRSVLAADAAPAVQMDLSRCDSCRETAALQLKHITLDAEESKKGKREEKDEDLGPCFLLNPAELRVIDRIANKAAGPPQR